MFFLSCALFILGLLIGSFLNVLIDRLPNNESPFKGRSHCDHCRRTLGAFDLIPVISFLILGGKCRSCKKKISWQYPVVELFTGAMFLFLFSFFSKNQIFYSFEFPNFLGLASLLILFCSFLVIFVADLKYQIIPDEMLVSAVLAIVIYHLISTPLSWMFLFNHLTSGIAGAGFFLGIYALTRGRGIGFGDVKLTFLLGLFLGFPGILIGLYGAFLTGAAVSSILIISGKKHWGQRIAFGPFLIFGTVTSFFFGNSLLQWYFSLLH